MYSNYFTLFYVYTCLGLTIIHVKSLKYILVTRDNGLFKRCTPLWKYILEAILALIKIVSLSFERFRVKSMSKGLKYH